MLLGIKRKYIRGSILLAILLLTFAGCEQESFDSPHEYLAWLNDPDNGLVKQQQSAELVLSLKYLDPRYMEYLDRAEVSPGTPSKDAQDTLYGRNIYFLLNISPRAAANVSHTSQEGAALSQQAGDINRLNFDLADFFRIRSGDIELEPVLAVHENTQGLGRAASVVVAFPRWTNGQDILDSKAFQVTFVDPVFETGVHSFPFQCEDIHATPHINF